MAFWVRCTSVKKEKVEKGWCELRDNLGKAGGHSERTALSPIERWRQRAVRMEGAATAPTGAYRIVTVTVICFT